MIKRIQSLLLAAFVFLMTVSCGSGSPEVSGKKENTVSTTSQTDFSSTSSLSDAQSTPESKEQAFDRRLTGVWNQIRLDPQPSEEELSGGVEVLVKYSIPYVFDHNGAFTTEILSDMYGRYVETGSETYNINPPVVQIKGNNIDIWNPLFSTEQKILNGLSGAPGINSDESKGMLDLLDSFKDIQITYQFDTLSSLEELEEALAGNPKLYERSSEKIQQYWEDWYSRFDDQLLTYHITGTWENQGTRQNIDYTVTALKSLYNDYDHLSDGVRGGYDMYIHDKDAILYNMEALLGYKNITYYADYLEGIWEDSDGCKWEFTRVEPKPIIINGKSMDAYYFLLCSVTDQTGGFAREGGILVEPRTARYDEILGTYLGIDFPNAEGEYGCGDVYAWEILYASTNELQVKDTTKIGQEKELTLTRIN